jgi:HEAT repeat protein
VKPVDETLSIRGRTVAEWLGQLSAADPANRREAIEALSEAAAGLSVLLRRLAGAMRAPADSADRAALMTVLGRVGAQVQAAVASVHALLKTEVLTDATEEVRSAGLNALSLLGPRTKTDVPALMTALRDELDDVRLGAARQLGEWGPDARDAIPALIPLTQYDADPRVRSEAAFALWRIDHRPSRVVSALIASLLQPDEVARWIAADCLGEIGPDAREAVPALLEAYRLPTRSGLIRVSIRLALERIDPAAAARLPDA